MVSRSLPRQEARSVPELDKGMDHVQDRSVQTSRLAWPALSPGQARLCLREKFARKNCPAAREGAADGHNDQFLFLLVISIL